jgi:hypothetical protein
VLRARAERQFGEAHLLYLALQFAQMGSGTHHHRVIDAGLVGALSLQGILLRLRLASSL